MTDQERTADERKWGCGRLLGSCLVAAFLCFVAMVAVLQWLKDPRHANEARAIGDIRTVISAQAVWQSVNGGYYEGNLSCLASPVDCIPNYPANAPTFLDSALASQQPKDGYARAFGVGSRPKKIDRRVHSPSSVTTWTYAARPVERGKTGYRSFFADETGVIRATDDDRWANASDPPID
jgi:hypothetical protein